MTAPAEPRILAEVGGLVVAEHGPLVLVVDRRTGPWATFAFVLGVLALVFVGFGVVSVASAAIPTTLGVVFVIVGIAVAASGVAVVTRIRRSRLVPVSAYRPVAVFDRARRVMIDADGTTVAALDDVRFRRETQLTSSSPMLVAVTPAGTRIIARGNPFNGGLGDLEQVLTAAVRP